MKHGRGRSSKTIATRDLAHDILAEIQPATVRAVCYRLFVLKAIPDMSTRSTQRVSRRLTDAREEGHIPWEWIVDENRVLERVPQWDNPEDFTQAVKRSYRRDLWNDQPQRVEVWSEKGTMRGTLKTVLDTYGVGFRVMHGFSSATVMKDIALATEYDRLPLRIFYIGDWDPSGMYMSERDFDERLDKYGARVELTRLALTEDDLHRADMTATSFPASDKRRDPRYQWFITNIGRDCWELDALSPVVIRDRVETAILSMITNVEAWNRFKATEAAELDSLQDVLGEWARMKVA
jgi:hypothetical protein